MYLKFLNRVNLFFCLFYSKIKWKYVICNFFCIFLFFCNGMFCMYDCKIINNKNRVGGKLSWSFFFMRDKREDCIIINWFFDVLSKYLYRNCRMLIFSFDWVGVVLFLFMIIWCRICLMLFIMFFIDKVCE